MTDLHVPQRRPRPEAVDEPREGWGMSTRSLCRVVHPRSAEDVLEAFKIAEEQGLTVAHWGNGRSYGDAALNESNLLLDFSQMDRILEWDPERGIARVQPGVTLNKLWRRALPDGWWPSVVTGTMFTTIGGITAANAHGKNNWKHGPHGEYVLGFTLVTPDGEVREVTRKSDPDLFHATVGGFGWTGTFVEITIQLKKVHSGRVEVEACSADDLAEMFRLFELYNGADWDYVVGWIDAYARGASLGRGQIHAANYLKPGQDPDGERMFNAESQELPPRMYGILPFSWLHWFGRPFGNRWGMRLINFGRFHWMRLTEGSDKHRFRQPHVQFNHLLDFVPNWKFITKPGGLIQFQLFLPKSSAQQTTRRVFELAQAAGLEPYLVVMKRHRADAFWLSHAVDGYSFAMDFFVTDRTRQDLYQLTQVFADLVVEAGGRFYFAKDSTVTGKHVRRSLGDDLLGRFLAVKQRVDPKRLMVGNQWRRIFASFADEVPLIEAREEPAPADDTAPEKEAGSDTEAASNTEAASAEATDGAPAESEAAVDADSKPDAAEAEDASNAQETSEAPASPEAENRETPSS